MKILYIVSGTGLSGGATKSFLRMINGIINSGHSCYVVCPNQNGLYVHLKNIGVPVYYVKYLFNANLIGTSITSKIKNWLKWERRKYYNIYNSKRLIDICKDIKPDIIHTNSSIINVGYLAAKKLNIPHITHFREYGDIDFNYNIHGLEKQLTDKYNYFISITKDIAINKHLPLDRTEIIYNGICKEEDIRFSENKKKYILFAGRIQKTKGIIDLIDAYIKYCNMVTSPLKLKIAGNFDSKEGKSIKQNLDSKLDDNNILDNVEWLGECQNLPELMYHAYATIIPSINEGFGRVMPEAIANGSLVIGRNTGGTKEQFDNGNIVTGHEIGLRFSTTDELVNNIYTIHMNGITKYYPMIFDAQTTVRNLYTIQSYHKNILVFYNHIFNQLYENNE